MSTTGLDRRSFLAAGAAGAAGLLTAPAASGHSRRGRRPNIVLVVFDDLGVGDFGAYGNRLIRTRQIDKLARNGVRFDAMYAAGSTDSPSRAGLFTGRYGARFRIPASIRPDVGGGLPADVPTVATALRSAGYATALFGQWRLGSGAGQHPLDKGFDRFSGTLYGSDVTPLAWHQGRTQTEAATDLGLTSWRIHDAAEAFLDDFGRSNRTPFFMVLSHLVPHAPYVAEPRYAGRSDAGAYGDTIEIVDRYLEHLVSRLERTRNADTLVIITSDNGPRYEGSNQRRRGRKPEVMDGGVLVPFVASWLDRRLGFSDRVPRSLLDLTPTLCAVAGAQAPASMDGAGFSSLLNGRRSPRGPVFLFYNEWLNAMRSEDWKLHVRYGNDTRTYMPMLYDVRADPRESNNLAEYRPEIVTALQPQLEAVRASVNAEAAERAAGVAA